MELDAKGGLVTAQETAAGLVKMLAAVGLTARVHATQNGAQWVVVGSGPMEEPVFEVTAEAPGDVRYLSLRLGRTKALRAKTVAATVERDIRQRCADIADRYREHTANREAQQKAWAVVGKLKPLGMPCTATGGRVVITLDLSPEYAAEVGPKIAAVMSENGVRPC
jgi:hypothetical protein